MEAENIESMDLESLKNLVEESIEDLVLEKMGSSLEVSYTHMTQPTTP